MFCGSAAMASGRTAGARRVMSTVSRVTSQDCPGAAPISTVGSVAGSFWTDMAFSHAATDDPWPITAMQDRVAYFAEPMTPLTR